MRGTYKSEVNIVISISGFWSDVNQLRKSINNSIKCKYWLAENFLCQKDRQKEFFFYFQNYKSLLTIVPPLDIDLLNNIEENNINKKKSAVYLKNKGGSIETAKNIMLAANCILDNGGDEINVITSGITHSKENWKSFIEKDRLMDYIFAFVITIKKTKEDFYFTCGMHNLGYPDVVVPGYLESDQANYLAKAFCYYLLKYNPMLFSGGKFRIEPNSPDIYRYTYEKCHIYDSYNNTVYLLFHNPYGLWRLTESNLLE